MVKDDSFEWVTFTNDFGLKMARSGELDYLIRNHLIGLHMSQLFFNKRIGDLIKQIIYSLFFEIFFESTILEIIFLDYKQEGNDE